MPTRSNSYYHRKRTSRNCPLEPGIQQLLKHNGNLVLGAKDLEDLAVPTKCLLEALPSQRTPTAKLRNHLYPGKIRTCRQASLLSTQTRRSPWRRKAMTGLLDSLCDFCSRFKTFRNFEIQNGVNVFFGLGNSEQIVKTSLPKEPGE